MKNIVALILILGPLSTHAQSTYIIGDINEVTRLVQRKGIFLQGRVLEARDGLTRKDIRSVDRIGVRLPVSCHDEVMEAVKADKNTALLVTGDIVPGGTYYDFHLFTKTPFASLQFNYQKDSKTVCELITIEKK